jgi:hypothetical protein
MQLFENLSITVIGNELLKKRAADLPIMKSDSPAFREGLEMEGTSVISFVSQII